MKALQKIELPKLPETAEDAAVQKNKKNEDFLNQNFQLVSKAIYENETRIEALEKVVRKLGG